MELKIHKQREKANAVLQMSALSYCGRRNIPTKLMTRDWLLTTCQNCLSTGDNLGKPRARAQKLRLLGRLPNDRSPQTVETWLNT